MPWTYGREKGFRIEGGLGFPGHGCPKQTRLALYALGPSPSWKDACGKPAFAQAVTRFFGADTSGPLMPDIRDGAGRPHLRKSGILSGFACQPGCLSKWFTRHYFLGEGDRIAAASPAHGR